MVRESHNNPLEGLRRAGTDEASELTRKAQRLTVEHIFVPQVDALHSCQGAAMSPDLRVREGGVIDRHR